MLLPIIQAKMIMKSLCTIFTFVIVMTHKRLRLISMIK